MRNNSIWKYITNYKTNSVIFKHFFSILLIIILPMTLLFGSIYLTYQEQAKAEFTEAHRLRLSNIANSLDNIYSQMRLFTYSLANDPLVWDFMQETEIPALYEKADYSSIVGTAYLAYRYIESVYLYSDMNRYVLSGSRNDTIENFPDKSWLKNYSYLQKNEIAVVPRKIGDSYPYCLSFILVQYDDAGNKAGAVVVNINIESLLRTVVGSDLSPYEIYVLDGFKKLVLSTNIEQMFNTFNQYAFVYDRIAYAEGHKNETFLYTLKSQESGLEYVSLATTGNRASRVKSVLIGTALVLFMLLTTMLVSVLLAVRTFKPIQNIIETVGPNFDSDNQTGIHDEISFIIENINHTIQDKRLVELEFENRMILLNNAYAAALQAQINPHFLYNTLETINFLAYSRLKGANDISAATINLSKMLRISLDNEDKIVPLHMEVEHLSLYISIMELRYPNKCRFVFAIPDELMDCLVVKLMLQPLVENAFQHGIRPSGQGGTITVSAHAAGADLIFEIRDDGVGMDAQALQSVQKILASDIYLTSKHIGINNVNRRIKMLFGDAYGLWVTSAPGQGTVFTISLPLSHREIKKEDK